MKKLNNEVYLYLQNEASYGRYYKVGTAIMGWNMIL